jgi:hypothetical protein
MALEAGFVAATILSSNMGQNADRACAAWDGE